MTDKIEISKTDIKPIQIFLWIITTINIFSITVYLIVDFTVSSFSIYIFILVINGVLQYSNKNMWNIWYEGGKIYSQNIYKTQMNDISLFKSVEMESLIPIGIYFYTLYLNNNKRYKFRLKPSDDFKLIFKSDSQFYAKELTQKLNNLKHIPTSP